MLVALFIKIFLKYLKSDIISKPAILQRRGELPISISQVNPPAKPKDLLI